MLRRTELNRRWEALKSEDVVSMDEDGESSVVEE